MNDFEQELAALAEQDGGQEEAKLPSLDEQKAIVEKLKALEAKGELTPEILEQYFGQYAADAGVPIH
ncbi:chromosome partitioning protein ParA [Vibrio gazogenes]|uniref:Chromosome partitioning protein ParA n=1 Tax=Vibrio gazogenes DSM 21264 = NBRC 103151 TaxID=1123492 RepID=A0A1M4SZU8_VIBGA|nr:chromosome partitioning protein ParA [Vibrio gazogenes]USP15985.1 restriction endonuclease subunit S [Vibrio gazogenes]SHE37693.1 hypothetical protein SAMN02745781_00196 [Vibrio gazogenes DSM 21264] [Vibrio gazogenes DSM 21264 = NBRC 103151]SJN54730.1 hypothetical protein BQ6471_01174 [Vibrio gazogenes]